MSTNLAQRIKDTIDIVTYVGSFVRLERAGSNTYRGLCPFHGEKTPSFYVYPSKGRWHCFGSCNSGGSVIDFAMRQHSWDISQTLRELAREAGIPVEADPRRDLRRRAMSVNRVAAELYAAQLAASPEARSYLQGRGITDPTVREWQLGYAGSDIVPDLVQRGFSHAEIEAAGLLFEGPRGPRSRFWKRVIIPIQNEAGEIVGFGGRILPGPPSANGQRPPAKFINTPATEIFVKGQLLFGLDRAIPRIRATDTAVIVEGYFDVICAHQAGFSNVVAGLGTAIGEAHARALRRHGRRIVLALDPDAGGDQSRDTVLEALQRATMVTLAEGRPNAERRLDADLRVLMLPEGQDPDEIVLHQPDLWNRLLDEACDLLDYYLLRRPPPAAVDSWEAKHAYLSQLAPVLREIAEPVRREELCTRLANRLGLRLPVIIETVRLTEAPAAAKTAARPEATPEPVATPLAALERDLLALVLSCPAVLQRARGPVADDFSHAGARALFEEIAAHVTSGIQETDRLCAAIDPLHRSILDEVVQRRQELSPTEFLYRRTALDLRMRRLQDELRDLTTALLAAIRSQDVEQATRQRERERRITESLHALKRARAHLIGRAHTYDYPIKVDQSSENPVIAGDDVLRS